VSPAKLTQHTRTLRYGLHYVPAYSGCFRLADLFVPLLRAYTSILSSGFSRVSKGAGVNERYVW
jgi:hypothetical protein